jgi:acyl carrier protein
MQCRIGSWLGFADSAGQRKIDAVFAGRTPLSDDAFYERYFATTDVSKEVAIGVRHAFIENLIFDMHRLGIDDRFDQELQFVWKYDSLADVELLCQVEKQFDISVSEAEGRETVTLGALIRLADRKVKAKKSA